MSNNNGIFQSKVLNYHRIYWKLCAKCYTYFFFPLISFYYEISWVPETNQTKSISLLFFSWKFSFKNNFSLYGKCFSQMLSLISYDNAWDNTIILIFLMKPCSLEKMRTSFKSTWLKMLEIMNWIFSPIQPCQLLPKTTNTYVSEI